MFTRYDLKNVKTVSYEVVSNRPKVNSFRAPCVPQVVFGVEGVIDELARKIGMDPIDLRLKNAATEGYKTIYGETFGPIGFVETLQAAKKCEHYNSPVPPGQGRGVAAGFWFNRGGETTGTLNIATDGSVTIILGTSDVAGSRISISMMAAEELGIPVDKVRAVMADTHSLGFNRVTAGSRTTFASGMIIVDSARKAIAELCKRAAQIWGVPEEGVTFEDGYCRPASSNVGTFEPLSIAQIAAKTTPTHGAISGHSEMNVTGAGPGFGLHIVDVEVDKETGRVDIKRYTVVEDAGKAIHPAPGRGPIPGRRRAGHRLGAQRGILLRRRRPHAERELPRLSHAGRFRRADDRHRDRRGAQSAAPVWAARRRRGAGGADHGGDRQCDRRRHRHTSAITADVAAEAPEADGRKR